MEFNGTNMRLDILQKWPFLIYYNVVNQFTHQRYPLQRVLVEYTTSYKFRVKKRFMKKLFNRNSNIMKVFAFLFFFAPSYNMIVRSFFQDIHFQKKISSTHQKRIIIIFFRSLSSFWRREKKNELMIKQLQF